MADIYTFLKDYLPRRAGRTVIELGANRGTDTLKMLTMLKPPYAYYAFEPDPRHWKAMETYAGVLDFQFIKKAVGATAGRARFWLSWGKRAPGDQEHADSSSLMRPTGIMKAYPWMDFQEAEVNVIPLDTFRAEAGVGTVDFIWADVQGAELEVIRGGQATFRQTAYFYTECYQNGKRYYEGQPRLDDILAALPGNWQVVFCTTTDVLLKNLEGDA